MYGSIEVASGLETLGSNNIIRKIIITDRVLTVGSTFGYSSAREIYVGDNVTTIADNAFTDSSLLQKVVIGKSIESIGRNAFKRASNNWILYIQSETPPNISSSIFGVEEDELGGYSPPSKIIVPNNALEAYKQAWGANSKIVSLLDSEALISNLIETVGDINTALEAILGV